jgi:hypothetical protein
VLTGDLVAVAVVVVAVVSGRRRHVGTSGTHAVPLAPVDASTYTTSLHPADDSNRRTMMPLDGPHRAH